MLLAEVPEPLQELPVEGRERRPTPSAVRAPVPEEALGHDVDQLVASGVRDVEERAAAEEWRRKVTLGVARDDHDGAVLPVHLHGRQAELAHAELESLDAVQEV